MVLDEAHPRGLAVHAWVNTHLVWGPDRALPLEPDDHLRERPPGLARRAARQLASELAPVEPGRRARSWRALVRFAEENPATVEGVYTSPSHPEPCRIACTPMWMDLANALRPRRHPFRLHPLPLVGVRLLALGALERFRSLAAPRTCARAPLRGTSTGVRVADLFAFVDASPELWDEFRREQITGLVTRIRTRREGH